MKKATLAPIYAAALYPELAEMTRKHGYALAVHGSLSRDMDLTCIPWAVVCSKHMEVIDDICSRFDIRLIGCGHMREHGRIAYTISIGHGDCAIDLSFMPTLEG